MKRIVLIMQALLSVLIVNAQDFRGIDAYLAKISVIDSLLLDTKLKDRDRRNKSKNYSGGSGRWWLQNWSVGQR